MAVKDQVKETNKVESAVAAAPQNGTEKSPEKDLAFQMFLYRLFGIDPADKQRAEEQKQAEFLKALNDDFGYKSVDDLLSKSTLDDRDILSVRAGDKAATSLRMGEVRDYETGTRRYLVGRDLENFLVNQGISGSTGGKPNTSFKLGTVGETQGELVSAISKASAITGVPTALLGAMSGIESKFGKDLVSPTGALGSFQQTGGYRQDRWKQFGQIIAEHVPEVRAAYADGKLTKDEMKRLSFNNDAAALMTALSAKDFAKDYKLNIQDPKTWGLVYAEHNAGRGSVDKLLSGGMTEKWIRDANPAIYRNAGSTGGVLSTYQNKMMSWAENYNQLEQKVAGTKPAEPTVTVVAAAAAPAVKPAAATLVASAEPAEKSFLDRVKSALPKLSLDLS